MADNWSTFTTLAGLGDWIEWDVTLGAGEADYLNGAILSGGFADGQILLRYAKQSSADIAFGIIVNDLLLAGVGVAHDSSSPPGDSTRFTRYRALTTAPPIYCIQAFPEAGGTIQLDASVVADLPWVDGSNTVRVVNFGTEPIDIDFVLLSTHGGADVLDSIFIAAVPPSTYGTHVNGTHMATDGAYSEGGGSTLAWFLKAPDALATGTQVEATLDIKKFCPHATTVEVEVYVHDGVTPATGTIGVIPTTAGDYDQTNIATATLDGAGKAALTVPLGDYSQPSLIPAVWYGGDDNFGGVVISTTAEVGCNGWHVGKIGVG